MNIVDLIRTLVRERVDEVVGVITNIHGAVAGESPPLEVFARQEWLWTRMPARALLSLAEFFATNTTTSGVETELLVGKEGLTKAEATQQLHFIRGTVTVPTTAAIPMIVNVSGPGAEVAVYVDGTLQRRAVQTLQLALQLDPGLHTIELLAFSDAITIRLPGHIQVTANLENLRAPEWVSLTTGYLDPSMGVVANTLSWVNDARAGGWRVVRRSPELLGELLDIGDVGSKGEYIVVLSGDISGALELGEELLAGPSPLGTVITATYDATLNETYARMRLPADLTVASDNWIGRQVGSGRFDELTRIRKSSSTGVARHIDQNVRLGYVYEYKLQSFGTLDETQTSPWSDIRYMRAGDIDPPASIVFRPGYPRLEGRRINCRFVTPSDEDYAGVKVYFRSTPTPGVITGATLNSITDSSQSWAVNQFQGYTAHVFSGTFQAEDIWSFVASSDLTKVYASGDFPFVPSGGCDFELFYDRPVLTDYGTPRSEDQFSFDAIRDNAGVLDLGIYSFRSFDFVGNEQPVTDSGDTTWTFSGTTAPRTIVEFENRDEFGVISTTWVTAFFTVTPEISLVESGTLTFVSGDQVQDSLVGRQSGDYIVGTTNHHFLWMYPQGPPGALQPPRPVVRRVVSTEAPNTMYLDQAVPSGGRQQIQVGDAYEVYDGATYARVALTRATAIQQLLPIDGPQVFLRVGTPYEGLYVEFYSVVNGLEPEELRTTFVDDDDIAEISSLILSEPLPNQLYVRIDGWDDDCRYWRAYVKKALTDSPTTGWPTLTGLSDGPFDERYLKWDDSILAGTSFQMSAGTGCWYVIVVPVNSVNVDGPRLTCVRGIGGTVCTGLCVASGDGVFYDVAVREFDDPAPTEGKNLITWKFRDGGITPTRLQFRLAGRQLSAPSLPSQELTYTYRTTLGQRYVDQDARLGADPLNNELADGAVGVGTEASFVHAGLSTHTPVLLGGVWDIWSYTLEAYDGATLIDQYPIDFMSAYNIPSNAVQFSYVNAYNAYPGTNSQFCDDPYTNIVEWGITPSYTALDDLYTIRVHFQQTGDPQTYLLVDNLPLRQYTSWYHAISGYVRNQSCVGPIAVSYRYIVEIAQAPNVGIDSIISAWVSDTVYLCDGIPDPYSQCP